MTTKVTITVHIRHDNGEIEHIVMDASDGYIIGAVQTGCSPSVTYGGRLVDTMAAITCSMSEEMDEADMNLLEMIALSMRHYQERHQALGEDTP